MKTQYTLVLTDEYQTPRYIKGLHRVVLLNNQDNRKTLYIKTIKGERRAYYFKDNKVYSYSYKTHTRKPILGKTGYITKERAQ